MTVRRVGPRPPDGFNRHSTRVNRASHQRLA